MDDIQNLTAIIKTFNRPKCVYRLLDSIKKHTPSLKICVADDGDKKLDIDESIHLKLPYDIGLSAGRNRALEHIDTDYFLLLDDDLKFHKDTDINKLFKIHLDNDLDVTAGDYLKKDGSRQSWHGTIELGYQSVKISRGIISNEGNFQLCDMVHNFFIGHRQKVLNIGGWDEDLKLNEHGEFFIRLKKNNWRIGYVPSVTAYHLQESPGNYSKYRKRRFTDLAAKKHGIKKWTTMENKTIRF